MPTRGKSCNSTGSAAHRTSSPEPANLVPRPREIWVSDGGRGTRRWKIRPPASARDAIQSEAQVQPAAASLFLFPQTGETIHESAGTHAFLTQSLIKSQHESNIPCPAKGTGSDATQVDQPSRRWRMLRLAADSDPRSPGRERISWMSFRQKGVDLRCVAA